MFKDLLQKLKDALGGGGGSSGTGPTSSRSGPAAAPVINERMRRISAGEGFAGPRRRVQNLSGGNRSLTLEQIRAIRHEAERQRQEKDARERLEKVRLKLGRARVEQLAALPRVFDPEAVKTLQAGFPELTEEDLASLGQALPDLDRDLVDDLARVSVWGAVEQSRVKEALPEGRREELGARVVEILNRLSPLAREAVLRLDRVPEPGALKAQQAKATRAQQEDVKVAAHALAQFGVEDLPAVINPPPPRPPRTKGPKVPRPPPEA